MTYVDRRRERAHEDLRRAVSIDSDPQIKADMAVRAAEAALQALADCDPRHIDFLRLAFVAGDMRELALTAKRLNQ